MQAKLGIAFDGFLSTAQAIETAQHAVAAGARSLWVAEHLGYREAAMTCMASRSRRRARRSCRPR